MIKLISWANQRVPSTAIGLFRVLFGVLMIWEVSYWYQLDIIHEYLLGPKVHFNYDFLPLKPVSESMLQLLLGGLFVSTILITIGYYFRVAMIYFFIVFTYFFLLDKAFYNNHLYLISLLSFLMIFMPMDASYSLQKSRQKAYVPNWVYRLLQFQVVVVYFFGGIVKINPYWLDLHPATEILTIKAESTGIDFLSSKALIQFVAYGGLLFDLLIGPLLWVKKTRKIAFAAALCFNIMNAWIFNDINIFPFFMMGALILFVDHSQLKSRLKHKLDNNNVAFLVDKSKVILISIYLLIQLVLPLRHYFQPGYVDWTGEGQRFAWRMKIQHRAYDYNEVKFAIFDNVQKRIIPVEAKKYMNGDQYAQMLHYPRMVIQFAEFIKSHAAENHGLNDIMVKCYIPIAFNGNEKVLMFNPNDDLLKKYETYSSFNDWITPLPN